MNHHIKSPACRAQLGEDYEDPISLYQAALVHDPEDKRTRIALIHLLADGFEYALHELPSGVLYGQNGAKKFGDIM